MNGGEEAKVDLSPRAVAEQAAETKESILACFPFLREIHVAVAEGRRGTWAGEMNPAGRLSAAPAPRRRCIALRFAATRLPRVLLTCPAWPGSLAGHPG